MSSSAEAELHTRHITDLISSIPMDLLAQAAFHCGAHARALQYFETCVRTKEKGGLNPAAHYSATYRDDDVTFLQARHLCSVRPRSSQVGREQLCHGRINASRSQRTRLAHYACFERLEPGYPVARWLSLLGATLALHCIFKSPARPGQAPSDDHRMLSSCRWVLAVSCRRSMGSWRSPTV